MDEVAKQFDLERAQRNLEKLKPKLAIEDQERLNKLNRIIFSNKFFKPGVEETFVDSSFETAYRSP